MSAPSLSAGNFSASAGRPAVTAASEPARAGGVSAPVPASARAAAAAAAAAAPQLSRADSFGVSDMVLPTAGAARGSGGSGGFGGVAATAKTVARFAANSRPSEMNPPPRPLAPPPPPPLRPARAEDFRRGDDALHQESEGYQAYQEPEGDQPDTFTDLCKNLLWQTIQVTSRRNMLAQTVDAQAKATARVEATTAIEARAKARAEAEAAAEDKYLAALAARAAAEDKCLATATAVAAAEIELFESCNIFHEIMATITIRCQEGMETFKDYHDQIQSDVQAMQKTAGERNQTLSSATELLESTFTAKIEAEAEAEAKAKAEAEAETKATEHHKRGILSKAIAGWKKGTSAAREEASAAREAARREGGGGALGAGERASSSSFRMSDSAVEGETPRRGGALGAGRWPSAARGAEAAAPALLGGVARAALGAGAGREGAGAGGGALGARVGRAGEGTPRPSAAARVAIALAERARQQTEGASSGR